MFDELSMTELAAETCTVLPERTLLRRHRHFSRRHRGFGVRSSAHASFGSAANSNATYQVNFNPQIAINNGFGGGISISSHNTNINHTNQTAVPINFGN